LFVGVLRHPQTIFPYSQFSLKLCTDRPPGTFIESDSTICAQLYPPEDEHLRLETCRGEYYFMNKQKSVRQVGN